MGALGPKLFDDDCALDVRAEFRDLIGDGLTPRAATIEMVKSWSISRKEFPYEYTVFWLALAATQWRLGRLTPFTLRRALAIIDQGLGLDAWDSETPELQAKRRAVYRELRATLESPQPEPKRIPKRFKWKCPYERGDLLAYRCLSGNEIFLRVITVESHAGDEMVVDMCDYHGASPPSVEVAQTLPRRMPLAVPEFVADRPDRCGMFYLGPSGARDKPGDRLRRIGGGLHLPEYDAFGLCFGGFKDFDGFLERDYGIT